MCTLDDILRVHARASILQPGVVVAGTQYKMIEMCHCILFLKEIESQLTSSILLSERHAEGMLRGILRITAVSSMKQQAAIALKCLVGLRVIILD